MSLQPTRPELLETALFSSPPVLDPNPVEGVHGRLIPGYVYSRREFDCLKQMIELGQLEVAPSLRQLARITVTAAMGCWELPVDRESKNPQAHYGRMVVHGIHNPSKTAHRTMYVLFYGADSLPNGRRDYLDHLCGTKPCCYPRHLERVSPGLNTWRGQTRHARGQAIMDFKD